MIVAAGWWVALVELWPAGSRPYIGGSTNNSILELIVRLQRLRPAQRVDNNGNVGGRPAVFSSGADRADPALR